MVDYHALLIKLAVLRREVGGMNAELYRLQRENEALLAMVWALHAENAELRKAAGVKEA